MTKKNEGPELLELGSLLLWNVEMGPNGVILNISIMWKNETKSSKPSHVGSVLLTVMYTLRDEFDSLYICQATIGTKQGEEQKCLFQTSSDVSVDFVPFFVCDDSVPQAFSFLCLPLNTWQS